MTLLFLLPTLNMLAGRGYRWKFISTRWIRFMLMPFIVAEHYNFDITITIAAFASFALWASFGWGRYFSAFHGRYDPAEVEIRWIDWVGDKVYPNTTKWIEYNRMRGVFCMGLRGLFLSPLLLFTFPPGIVMMWFQGWCYYLGRFVQESKAVPLAEFLTGLLMVVLIY